MLLNKMLISLVPGRLIVFENVAFRLSGLRTSAIKKLSDKGISLINDTSVSTPA
jgi:hypothetical protein